MFGVYLVVEYQQTPKSFAYQPIDVHNVVSTKWVKAKRKRATNFPFYPLIWYFRCIFRHFNPVPKLKSLDSLLLNLVILLLEILTRRRWILARNLFEFSLLYVRWSSLSNKKLYKVAFYIHLLLGFAIIFFHLNFNLSRLNAWKYWKSTKCFFCFFQSLRIETADWNLHKFCAKIVNSTKASEKGLLNGGLILFEGKETA